MVTTEKVQVVTLDDFAAEFLVDDGIDLLKIDAEGFDLGGSFRGAEQLLSSGRASFSSWSRPGSIPVMTGIRSSMRSAVSLVCTTFASPGFTTRPTSGRTSTPCSSRNGARSSRAPASRKRCCSKQTSVKRYVAASGEPAPRSKRGYRWLVRWS